MKNDIIIREIQAADNPQIATLIRSVMTEFGAVGAGYSIEDAEVDQMFEAYAGARAMYYILEQNQKIIGGAGIAQLEGGADDICELKKMYFYPTARGLGYGKKLAQRLIQDARHVGYQKMYLETLVSMHSANHLYQRLGFQKLSKNMGNTGHCGCDAYYVMDLNKK